MFFCVILKTDANIVNIPLWCLVSNHISPNFKFFKFFPSAFSDNLCKFAAVWGRNPEPQMH